MEGTESRLEDGGEGVCLLSFDGSEIGTAELSLLLVLKEIMERIEYELDLDETPRPYEYFDLIGGTGAGGIFALFFVIWRLSVDEAIEAYQTLHEKVLKSAAWLCHDVDAAGRLLDNVINEMAAGLGKEASQILETARKSSTGCKAFTCTLNPDNLSSPRLFCTYRARANRSPKCTMAQALKASIAGPPHLGPVLLGRPAERFISAIQRVNNPTSQVLNEALAIFGSEAQVACVVSLGAGQRGPLSISSSGVASNSYLAKLVLDTDQSDQEMERRCGPARDFFFRFSVIHGLEELEDDSNALSKITTHSNQYLKLAPVGIKLDRLVKVLQEKPSRVSTGRINTILGPDAQDQTLEIVKDIRRDIKRKSNNDKDDRYHNIYAWLLPNVYLHNSMENCRNSREDGTGRWLLESNEFREWLSGDIKILKLEGIPGGGKTVLCSIVFDYLDSTFTDNLSVKILGSFITYDITKSIDDILCCLLCQVLDDVDGSLAPEIDSLYRKRSHGRPPIKQLKSVLQNRLTQASRTFIILDALDEFPSESREQLLLTLLDLSESVKLFVTSRPIPNGGHQDVSQKTVQMESSKHADLERFVKNRIRQDDRLGRLLSNKKELSDLVVDTVLKRCNEMFLLARFHMDELCTYRTPSALEKALASLPTTALAKYEITLDRITKQPGRDGVYALHALMWISLTKRERVNPWTLEQLAIAIASSSDELGGRDNTTVSGQDILEVCAGLIIVKNGVPSFVHLTAQEYFQVYFDKVNEDRFRYAQYALTVGCLRYICAPHSPKMTYKWLYNFMNLGNYWSSGDAGSFFGYCAIYWRQHAQHLLDYGGTEISFDLYARRLSLDLSECMRAEATYRDCNVCGEDVQLITALRKASLLSFCTCLLLAVELKRSIFLWKKSSLSFEAEKGHYEIVQLLLYCPNSEVAVNFRDKWGKSPLHYATDKGHQDVVQLFLGQPDVKPDIRDENGLSPLSYAARNGSERIVGLLFSRADVEADSKDEDGRSPLSYAAREGHHNVVELFLSSQDVDANSQDSYGQSPLTHAAKEGNHKVVEVLLNHPNVDADIRVDFGRSPLSHAAGTGHKTVVELLLSRPSVEVHSRDKLGRSPLSHAAQNEHWSVVELLESRVHVQFSTK